MDTQKPAASALAITFMLLASQACSAGSVVADKTLSSSGGRLSGPDFRVGPNLGRQAGGNLFHSFSQFNIGSDESITFTGPSAVRNVLVRVTGGEAARLDGTLSCGIPNANFFLMDPQGVVFGQFSQINVTGSFIVTTADRINLKGGGHFDASPPEPKAEKPLLTTAAPAAFGFLHAHPGGVEISGDDPGGSRLVAAQGRTISVIAGRIRIEGSGVEADAGRVNLVSVGSPATVHLDPTSPTSRVTVSGAKKMGDLFLSNAQINSDDGGSTVIRGRNLQADGVNQEHPTIAADADAVNGGFIDIALTGKLQMVNGASITANTMGIGNGADISVTAASIDLKTLITTIAGDTGGAGAGGNISLQAGDISIAGGALVSARTTGSGRGGDITVRGHSLLIDGQAVKSFTGLRAETEKKTTSDGGNITLTLDQLVLRNEGEISVTTKGAGLGGAIAIRANTVLLDGFGDPQITGLESRSGVGATGAGGSIDLRARKLTVQNGGAISVSTFNQGQGGSARIDADEMTLTGRAGRSKFTGIFARAAKAELGGGDAGDLEIRAGILRVSHRAQISTVTIGPGNGGSVNVSADNVLIDHHGSVDSGSFSAGRGVRAGIAGDVTVTGREIVRVATGGSISAAAVASTGGNVRVTSNGSIELIDGKITTTAIGNGGNVNLSAPLFITFVNSRLGTSSDDNGGNVAIDPLQLTLVNSSIRADAVRGRGGNISLASDLLLRLPNDAASPITASSRFGVSGSVNTSPANTDIARSLAHLPGSLQSSDLTLQPACGQAVNLSTFLITGQGSISEAPGEFAR